MACRARCIWQVLASLVLLGTGCPGEADDTVTPQSLIVRLHGSNKAFDLRYDTDNVGFEVRFSAADAEALGAPGTRAEREGEAVSIFVDTRFQSHSDAGVDLGPCLVDDVIVTNLDTGQEFIAIEAGDCIEDQWVYSVEGAYDYLIDAGPCTGFVTLEDGRELTVKCR